MVEGLQAIHHSLLLSVPSCEHGIMTLRKGGRAEPSYIPQIAGFPWVLQCWRRGLLLQKKKSDHTVKIISAVQLAPNLPQPLSLFLCLSLSLSHSLCESPADSGCIHPYINHSPYSIGYMVHGKY